MTGGSMTAFGPSFFSSLLHATMAANDSRTGGKAHAQRKSGPEDCAKSPGRRSVRGEQAQNDASPGQGEKRRGRPCRGRPRNPPRAVEGDTPDQAAVLPILSKMSVNALLQLCRKMNVDCEMHIHKEDMPN